METSTPIPILLCGKIPGHILATTDMVKPEYRVLKACPTVEDARETVASLLSPATETPTIEGIEYPRPRLVIMGGGFTPDDFMSVYETVDGAGFPEERAVGAAGQQQAGKRAARHRAAAC